MEKVVDKLIKLTKDGSITWKIKEGDSTMPFISKVGNMEFKIFNPSVLNTGTVNANLYAARIANRVAHKQSDPNDVLQLTTNGYLQDSNFCKKLNKLYVSLVETHYTPHQNTILQELKSFEDGVKKRKEAEEKRNNEGQQS